MLGAFRHDEECDGRLRVAVSRPLGCIHSDLTRYITDPSGPSSQSPSRPQQSGSSGVALETTASVVDVLFSAEVLG